MSATSVRFPAALAFLLLAAAVTGCGRQGAPRVISAELLDDKTADGQPGAGETIRVTLDRPLPNNYRPQEEVQVWTGPPRTRLMVRVRRGGPRTLEIELVSTPPAWQTTG